MSKTKFIPLSLKSSSADDNYYIDKYPELCPYCNVKIHIESHLGHSLLKSNNLNVAVFCPNCNKIFVANYKIKKIFEKDKFKNRNEPYKFNFTHIECIKPSTKYDQIIEENFPTILEILKQSEEAEKYSLNQLVGMGYRKALEFLIKEFCILKNPEKKEKIKKNLLSGVINDFIEDVRIKNAADRAKWLGNDETHYVKKWGNQDINDLKTLTNITIHFITMDILLDKYTTDMKNKN